MRNGVIGIPTHDFQEPSRFYYQEKDSKKYEFALVTYGVTSIPNFMKFSSTVFEL
jgi:hypothetical protein